MGLDAFEFCKSLIYIPFTFSEMIVVEVLSLLAMRLNTSQKAIPPGVILYISNNYKTAPR